MISALRTAVTAAAIAGVMGHGGTVCAAQGAPQDVVITVTGDKLIGEIIRGLMLIYQVLEAEEMKGAIEFL